MNNILKGGYSAFGNRELLSLQLDSVKLPKEVSSSLTSHFICLLALDAEHLQDSLVIKFANELLSAGCVYFCCWGPKSEKIHDLIDSTINQLSPDGPWPITTWHEEETIEEAIWFAVNVAWPDEPFENTCNSVIGISVNNTVWGNCIESAFSDINVFNKQCLKSE